MAHGPVRRSEIAPIVISIALATFTFSGLFYFGALLTEGSLQKYIIGDRTVIKSESVEMVTDVEQTGDPRLDKWIGTYAFARNMFGMSLVPLLILGALWIFA